MITIMTVAKKTDKRTYWGRSVEILMDGRAYHGKKDDKGPGEASDKISDQKSVVKRSPKHSCNCIQGNVLKLRDKINVLLF